MTAGLVIVVVIAVGLPLLAWWVGGRAFWGRLESSAEPDLLREMVRRHQLTPGEIAQVEGAVTWGRRLEDPRLRAAVVDWATEMQRRLERSRARHPRRHRIARLLIPIWLVYVVTAVGFGIADRDWGLLVNVVIFALAFGWPAVRASRGPRRALQLNADASTEPR